MIEAAVHEAKTKLTSLLKQVEEGERVVITRHGKPIPDLQDTKDPFDRLLSSQCEAEGMRLVTVDQRLEGHRLAWRP